MMRLFRMPARHFRFSGNVETSTLATIPVYYLICAAGGQGRGSRGSGGLTLRLSDAAGAAAIGQEACNAWVCDTPRNAYRAIRYRMTTTPCQPFPPGSLVGLHLLCLFLGEWSMHASTPACISPAPFLVCRILEPELAHPLPLRKQRLRSPL